MGTLQEPQPSASANERRAGSAANGRCSQRPGPRPRREQVGLTLLAPAPGPATRSPPGARGAEVFSLSGSWGWAVGSRADAEAESRGLGSSSCGWRAPCGRPLAQVIWVWGCLTAATPSAVRMPGQPGNSGPALRGDGAHLLDSTHPLRPNKNVCSV